MKKMYLFLIIFASFLAFLTCENMYNDIKDEVSNTETTSVEKITFTADGVSFNMTYVPGKTFPTGTGDAASATVTSAYLIGETEVTYELWKKVYDWATNAARGPNIYYFANAGIKGNDGAILKSDQHPVTTVNWRDSMVWCNAATEWYNSMKGTSYTCVYMYSSAIIRDSRDTNATASDGAVANSTKGFRLLTSNEWELAARWRSDSINTVSGYSSPWFTKGDSVSGATSDYTNAIATQAVAWYSDNSAFTHAVKDKIANSLILYDMCGNVWEWCFDLSGAGRAARGAGWRSFSDELRVGYVTFMFPYDEYDCLGFRLARSAD